MQLSSSKALFLACRVNKRTFTINPYLKRQNIAMQQSRALNLVGEICRTVESTKRRTVCIIGDGPVGRTAAAAFLCHGVSVIIVDKNPIRLSKYLDAKHRELHPTILDWPYKKVSALTSFPFLNWSQAPTPDVMECLEQEWNDQFEPYVTRYTNEVLSVTQKEAFIEINLKSQKPIIADLCFIATGFSNERGCDEDAMPSYWSLSSVCAGDEGAKYFVSGSGDGALIDSLSPIFGSRTTQVAHVIASHLREAPIIKDIIDEERRREQGCRLHSQDSSFACDFYRTTHISTGLLSLINTYKTNKSENYEIIIAHSSNSLFSYSAAPLNKLDGSINARFAVF